MGKMSIYEVEAGSFDLVEDTDFDNGQETTAEGSYSYTVYDAREYNFYSGCMMWDDHGKCKSELSGQINVIDRPEWSADITVKAGDIESAITNGKTFDYTTGMEVDEINGLTKEFGLYAATQELTIKGSGFDSNTVIKI